MAMQEYQSKTITPRTGGATRAKAQAVRMGALADIASKASSVLVGMRREEKMLEAQQEAKTDVMTSIANQQLPEEKRTPQDEIALKTSGTPLAKMYNSTLLAQSDEQYKSLLSSKAKELQAQYQADPDGFRNAYESYYKGMNIKNPILQLSAEKYARDFASSANLTLTKQYRKETGDRQKKTTKAKMATLQNDYAISLMTGDGKSDEVLANMRTFLTAGDRLFPYSQAEIEYEEQQFIKGATTQLINHTVESYIKEGSTTLEIEELFEDDSILYTKAGIDKTLTQEEIDELRTDSISRAKEHRNLIQAQRKESEYRDTKRQEASYATLIKSYDKGTLSVSQIKEHFSMGLINPTQRKDLLNMVTGGKGVSGVRSELSTSTMANYVYKAKTMDLGQVKKLIKNDVTLLPEDKIKLYDRIDKLSNFTTMPRYKAGKEVISNEFKARLSIFKDENGEISPKFLELQRNAYLRYFEQVSLLKTSDEREANADRIAERVLDTVKGQMDVASGIKKEDIKRVNKNSMEAKQSFRKGFEDLTMYNAEDSTKILDNVFKYFNIPEIDRGGI